MKSPKTAKTPPVTPKDKTKEFVVLSNQEGLGRKGQIVTLTETAAKDHKKLVRVATRNDLAIAGRRQTPRAK